MKPEVERVILPATDRILTPPERFEAAVDDECVAVATSHVTYLSGAIQDFARVARAARDHGAVSITASC